MTKHHPMIFAAALLIAGGGLGFTAARLMDHPALSNSADEHGHKEATHAHEENEQAENKEHAEGFVALKVADAAAAGVQVFGVERGGGAEILLPGRVAFAPNAQATIGAPLSGAVVQVHVAAGTHVAAGAPIVTLNSAEGARARATLDTALASADAARAAEAREERLFKEGVVASQDWETARAVSLKAQAELRAAQALTAAIGAPGTNGITVIRSPVAGVVTRVSVAPGSVLAQGAEVAEVVDPKRIELLFEAPPANLAAITLGSTLEARLPDGQLRSAVVTAIAPGVAGTRTGAAIRARPDGPPLSPGTVVSGRLAGKNDGAFVVPSEAIQTVEGRPCVFVVDGDGFRATPIVPGQAAFGRTEIRQGLTGSERLAAAGSFLLKAELAKGEAGHEH